MPFRLDLRSGADPLVGVAGALGNPARTHQAGTADQNGRHQRMHRTLGEDAVCPPQPTLHRQQRAFDDFRTIYNDQRPHEALGQQPPTRLYWPSPRPFPRRLTELEYASDVDLRSVHQAREVRWRSDHLFLSEALIGEVVGFEPIDLAFGASESARWCWPTGASRYRTWA
jgi:hypothetical protein